MNYDLITHVAAASILIATAGAGIAAWFLGLAGRRAALIWPAYGVVLAAASYWSVRLALLSVGMLAPLLGHNIAAAWGARVLGEAQVRRQMAQVLSKGGRAAYVATALGSAIARATPGAVLVLAVTPDHPLAMLGWGQLAAVLGVLASVVRLTVWPPKPLREELLRVEQGV